MRGSMLDMVAVAALLATAVAPAGAASDPKRKLPYYGSIAAVKARMRTGPGRTYPASWLYVRPELPVRVIASFKEWRKVEDPGGTQGWMLANLLSDKRTGFVPGSASATPADSAPGAMPIGAVEMRDRASAQGRVLWRAAPGVVGRLSQCVGGWCRFDVRGQAGFVEEGRLWGVDQGETVP